MADLRDIVAAVFYNKPKYKNLTDEDKEANFFIFNRYMCKNFPNHANFFNSKVFDKVIAFDIWFDILSNVSTVPKWWDRGNAIKKSITYPNVKKHYSLNDDDIYMLECICKEKLVVEEERIKTMFKSYE